MIEIILIILFALSIGLIIYTYFVYPLILYIWYATKRTDEGRDGYTPAVSLIIAAHNEENIIDEKIQNIFNMNYPSQKLEVLIGLDGCTDRTAEILKNYKNSQIKVFDFEERRGKSAVVNELVARSSNEILVFSDANTIYYEDTIQKLVRHFNNASIGGVCGRLDLVPFNKSVSSMGESTYWRYENMLKLMEGNIHTTIGATGAVYAIRRSLFKDLPVDKIVMDDFLIPLAVVAQGVRVIYDHEAGGYEKTTASMQHEFSRKVRIGIANFVGLSEIRHLLSPRWKFVAFSLWSHKVIRWIVPVLMILGFAANLSLVLISGYLFYIIAFLLQISFYTLAAIGYVLDRFNIPPGIMGYPYFFVSMHYALLLGLVRFLQNKRQPMWKVYR
jgi:poly-beta-1,6-N-acetyl-D-glucosamine synthase